MVFNKLNRVCNIKFYSISKHRQEFQYDIFIYNGSNIFSELLDIIDQMNSYHRNSQKIIKLKKTTI